MILYDRAVPNPLEEMGPEMKRFWLEVDQWIKLRILDIIVTRLLNMAYDPSLAVDPLGTDGGLSLALPSANTTFGRHCWMAVCQRSVHFFFVVGNRELQDKGAISNHVFRHVCWQTQRHMMLQRAALKKEREMKFH